MLIPREMQAILGKLAEGELDEKAANALLLTELVTMLKGMVEELRELVGTLEQLAEELREATGREGEGC